MAGLPVVPWPGMAEQYKRVHRNGGSQKWGGSSKWMVYFMENPTKMDENWG